MRPTEAYIRPLYIVHSYLHYRPHIHPCNVFLNKTYGFIDINTALSLLHSWYYMITMYNILITVDKLIYIALLEKHPTLFFCENLVDSNEAHFHEATLNLHTHA
jgi:hypothetical protein